MLSHVVFEIDFADSGVVFLETCGVGQSNKYF
jgi:hypothetical protein